MTVNRKTSKMKANVTGKFRKEGRKISQARSIEKFKEEMKIKERSKD